MAKRSKKTKRTDSGDAAQAAGKIEYSLPLPSWLDADWLAGLLLVFAVILTYQPVWGAGYIWDDDALITNNPCVVGPLGLKEIWTTSAADICPLTISSFWLEHALWGLAPLPFHLVNVLLHGGCAVVLGLVLRRLSVPGAWLGAALWALHPVQVESVAWITETKNTESGFFFLLSIFFFLKRLDVDGPGARITRGWSYVLTMLFAALAMASKSSTVILPVVLGLCAWWQEGRWHGRNLASVGPIFLLSLAVGALSLWTQGLQLATDTDPRWDRPWPERLVEAGCVVWFYLGKLVWPHPLIIIYPRWEIDAGQGLSYLPLIAVFVVLLILWVFRKSWARPWFFTFAFFLTALFPVLGLVNLIWFLNSFVADHLQYLASMGPLALAGVGIAKLAEFALPAKPWLRAGVCGALLVIPAGMSWQRGWAFENLETLCTDTLAKNPTSWVAHNSLGVALSEKGRGDEAMAQFQKALEINPHFAETHNNLGNALLQSGQVDDAMAEYQKTLAISPENVDAHNNLGWALLQKKEVDEAISECRKALALNPNFADAHGNLGIAFSLKGQADDAEAEFRQALALKPDDPKIHYNLGNILLAKGQVDEAISEFQETLQLNPSDANAQRKLAKAQAMEQAR